MVGSSERTTNLAEWQEDTFEESSRLQNGLSDCHIQVEVAVHVLGDNFC